MDLLHQSLCMPGYDRLLKRGHSLPIEAANVVSSVGRKPAGFLKFVGPQVRIMAFKSSAGLRRLRTRRYGR